jgi:hypothetical protein
MQMPHHPQVSRRNDGRWVLHCPECQRDSRNGSVPIGIGLPVECEDVAVRLRENHVGSSRRPRR